MVVNNYYYANAPKVLPKSAEGIEVHNFLPQNDAVSNKEVQSPEAVKQEVAAEQTNTQTNLDKAVVQEAVDVVKQEQVAKDKVQDTSAITGLGSSIDFLA